MDPNFSIDDPYVARDLLRALVPVGGVYPASVEPEDRKVLTRALYEHIKGDKGYMPRWLREEVEDGKGPWTPGAPPQDDGLPGRFV